MSTDFLLDENGDLPLYAPLVTGDAIVLQRVKRRLSIFGPSRIEPTSNTPAVTRDGEWIIDGSKGLRFLDWRRQKPPDLPGIGAFIIAELVGTPGVESVRNPSTTFDVETRTVSFTATIVLESGSLVPVEFAPALGANSLPYVAILYPSLTVIP